MTDWKLQLYHRLPPFLRNVAASFRGLQLRHWRYGPETEELVAQALERDYWSPEQWKTYQENQLAYILHRAATHVPYYRELWAERRRRGDRSSWEHLENWPILEKEPLRTQPEAFVADDYDIRKMFHDHTSGTTGTPLHVYRSQSVLRAWYALFEARWRRWYGISFETPWAILGGQLVTPVDQNHPPYWVWNRPMNQLYMSSYHISAQTVEDYLKALEKHQVEYIYCYTSAGYSLADEILRKGLQAPQMKVVVTNAEPVFDYQRERISEAFDCSVKETYGQAETVMGASECQSGRLHLWPEVGVCEVIEGQQRLAHGQSGDALATGLLNDSMLFVRYRLGDRLALEDPTMICDCGRRLPMLKHIEGRSDDTLYTVDGRRIGRLDPVFKSDIDIREAQIVQEALQHIVVRVVPSSEYNIRSQEAICRQLRARMGQEMHITFEEVDEIPRTPNGKFQAVICNLSPEERQRVQ